VAVTNRARELGPLLRARHGGPVRKLGLRLPARCPNRDGTLGTDGCLFCAEESEPPPPLEAQVEAGLLRGSGPLIAYLQGGTATAGIRAEELREILARLRAEPRIVAIHVGTRPDALPPAMLEVLADDARRGELLVELGLQSANDETLRLCRRRHGVACFVSATRALQARGVRVCAHVILGLPTLAARPEESLLPAEDEEGAAATARLLAQLEVSAVKLHNAHVLEGTGLARFYRSGRYRPPELEGYLERLIAFLSHLPEAVEIHRLVGEARLPRLIAPAFTAEKARSLAWIRSELERRDVRQGARIGERPIS
jgi:radical SAM protein (TIGR01212 family)